MKIRAWSSNAVLLAVVVMGLFLHGWQANQLGLYWDEAEQFLQPFQAVEGDILKYVFGDSFGYLDKERPLAHLFMVIHRAAFAVRLPLLHWTVVVLFVMNAALLAAVAGKILNEKWFVFAVGVIFITYPLSPLQAFKPMVLPYLWSSLLALLTILFVVHGLTVSDKKKGEPHGRVVGGCVRRLHMEVKTEEGEIQIVYSNLKRILPGKPVTTAAWRHVAG